MRKRIFLIILRRILPYLVFLILAGVVVFAGFFLSNTTTFNSNKKEPEGFISQRDARTLAERVGKLIILPTDEVPTVATVSDPGLLKSQSFFADSKKGDKVLIYTNARKAVLYRPDINKVVTIAPLNIGEEERQSPSAGVPEGLDSSFIGGEF